MTNYENRLCYGCAITIMVATHDISERNYCQTCAFSKIGAVRLSYDTNREDAND